MSKLSDNASSAIDDAWGLVGTWLREDDLATPAIIFIDHQADSIRIVRDARLPQAEFESSILDLARSTPFDQVLMVARASVGAGLPSPDNPGADLMRSESAAMVACVCVDGQREMQLARLSNVDGVVSLGAITSMPMPAGLLDQIVAQRETAH